MASLRLRCQGKDPLPCPGPTAHHQPLPASPPPTRLLCADKASLASRPPSCMTTLLLAVLLVLHGPAAALNYSRDNCDMPKCACRKWPPVLTEPNASCPIFFAAGPQVGAGLGHAFHNFQMTVQYAINKGVTLHTVYYTEPPKRLHPHMIDFFFGQQFNATLPADCEKRTFRNLKDVSAAIAAQRQQCKRGPRPRPVYLELWNFVQTHSQFNYHMFRQAFEAQARVRRALPLPWAPRPPGLRIAVHLRRGDIMQPKYISRALPNRHYVDLLNRIIPLLREKLRDPVTVLVNVQHMLNLTSVLDRDGNYTDFAGPVRARHANVRFELGPADPLAAFETLCSADVAILSNSGFSFLAMIMCRRPIFMSTMGDQAQCRPTAYNLRTAADFDDDTFVSYRTAQLLGERGWAGPEPIEP